MGGLPGTHGKLLNHAREFAVCLDNMHEYTVSHNISVFASCMAGLQCKVRYW